MLYPALSSAAQESVQAQYLRRFQNGTQFYMEARWHEAAAEFRFAQEIAVNTNDWAQALYWVILTQLALADYGSALRDMDELQRVAPNSIFNRDMLYHRARAYFNHGFFEDALILFNQYNESVSYDDPETADRKAAAFFWMGESLFSMGQFDEAERLYSWVISRYPNSPRVEISGYRIDLIKQKKIEAELLALLRWSHEESLRTSEDYQRRIRTYENILNAYQRRIAELTRERTAAGISLLPENDHLNGLASINDDGFVYAPPVPPNAGIQENGSHSFRNGAYNGNAHDDLVQRARRLEHSIERLLRDYEQNYGGVQ
jgi:TolA-binding protein